MPEAEVMKCPGCATEMNHHADKLDYGAASGDASAADEDGVVVEAHACPGCGRSETRPARAGDVPGE